MAVSNKPVRTPLPGRGGRANRSGCASLQPELSAALSASLRVELLREIDGLNSTDGAALCAKRHHDDGAHGGDPGIGGRR